MSVKITALLDGVPRLIRQIQLADTTTREATKGAVSRGTKRVASGARRRAPQASGELVSTIRDEYSKDGMVGYVKVGFGKLPRRSQASKQSRRDRLAKRRRARGTRAGKGAYGPVIEYGDKRRNREPKPYIRPAFEAEKPSIIAELEQATKNGARASGLT